MSTVSVDLVFETRTELAMGFFMSDDATQPREIIWIPISAIENIKDVDPEWREEVEIHISEKLAADKKLDLYCDPVEPLRETR